MPTTYEPIATQTLGSSTTTVTFSSIPNTYTDLLLVSVFAVTAGMDILLRFNGDSSSNYSATRLFANNSSSTVTVGRVNSYTGIQPRTSADQQLALTTILKHNIMNYLNTNTNKVVLGRYDYPSQIEMHTGVWRSTAAITSLSLTAEAGPQFATNSIFTLYGIKAA
jgi:hypothetical protein